jgi:hypothetical protein
MAFIPHVRTSKNVTVYLDGQQHIVAVDTPQFDLVTKAIEAGDLQAARDAVNIRQAVVKMSQGKIELDGTTLKYDGRPLHGALVSRILTVIKGAGDAAPLLTFLENLMQNPSKRAVDELYGFMEVCDLPITVDGHFLAYKKVRNDYTSVHDGKTDNSIGAKPSMPRNAVNDNKDETCSTGLHFCSESYLSHFGGERIVVLKINPADVVSIPTDYNNAKGRACTYEIVGELKTNDRTLVEKLSANFDTTFVQKTAVQALKDAAPAPLTTAPKAKITAAKVAPVAQKSVGKTSLTDAQVREIRDLIDEGWTIVAIAKSVGTSERTVARIRDGETYTDVV